MKASKARKLAKLSQDLEARGYERFLGFINVAIEEAANDGKYHVDFKSDEEYMSPPSKMQMKKIREILDENGFHVLSSSWSISKQQICHDIEMTISWERE